MNKSFVTAAVGAVLAVAGAPAHALEAKISGQVSRALMMADDGVSTNTFHADNVNSSTRFRFTGTEEILPGWKAGVRWEVEYRSNPTSAVSQASKSSPATGSPTFGERHVAAFLESGIGKFTIGQTDGAANAATEVDLSGTDIAHYASTSDIGGGLQFRNGAGALSGTTIGNVQDNFDFLSRYDLFRYDTPKLGPVTLSVATGTTNGQDAKDVALWFSTDLGGAGKIAAALGSSVLKTGTAAGEVETTGGSISWLSRGGFSVTFSTASRENDATLDADNQYLKLGYQTGMHFFSVDLSQTDDLGTVGNEAKETGVAYVFKPKNWVDLFAAYKVHSLDRAGASFEDINILTTGLRVKF
jgi:Gram-negative porin